MEYHVLPHDEEAFQQTMDREMDRLLTTTRRYYRLCCMLIETVFRDDPYLLDHTASMAGMTASHNDEGLFQNQFQRAKELLDFLKGPDVYIGRYVREVFHGVVRTSEADYPYTFHRSPVDRANLPEEFRTTSNVLPFRRSAFIRMERLESIQVIINQRRWVFILEHDALRLWQRESLHYEDHHG